MSTTNFARMYPDVLSAITGGKLINTPNLQCALGIFPKTAFINQPIEAVIILQNTVDQPVQVKLSLNFPTEDRQKNRVVLSTPQKVITAQVAPGEVGVLHVPIIAYPPTRPNNHVPVHVALRSRVARQGKLVRPLVGGYPPAHLNISRFKLQALRDVEFIDWRWGQSTDILTAHFDIAPRRLSPPQERLETRYEVIWDPAEAQREHQAARAKFREAYQLAHAFDGYDIYDALIPAVRARFKQRGLPLAEAEALAVANAIGYVIIEAIEIDEEQFVLEQSNWFQMLCHVLAFDENAINLPHGRLAVDYLLVPALYDAILKGFKIIDPLTKETLGSSDERRHYAERVMSWYGGQIEPDINYAYLPLVLAGLAVNHNVAAKYSGHAWSIVMGLYTAYQQRLNQVSDDNRSILELIEPLLPRAEEELVLSRVPRP